MMKNFLSWLTKSTVLASGSTSNVNFVRQISSGGVTYSGETVSASSALGLSAVWGCVNLISGTIGSLPLVVYREGSRGRQISLGHPLYRILHDAPNFDQTALDFWEFCSASLELWGNAYAEIIRNGQGRIISLRPISPSGASVRRLEDGRLEYQWVDENGSSKRETEERVLHIRGFGGAPLGGMSTLQFARESFGVALAADRAAASTFKNGLRTSGALSFAEWLNPEQRRAAEEILTEKYYGAVNSGRPLILEGGVSWQGLQMNPEDAQMLESRRFGVEEICRFFGVPPHMVGHTENSTSWGTGLEQQTLGFQKFTLRRRLKRIEQALEHQLLSPAERASGVSIEFNLDGLLRGDSGARSAAYESGLQNGYMTINEVRGLENLPPVEGGDVPRMQMQNVPITEAGSDEL